MRRNWKRIVALLLATCLLLGVIPAAPVTAATVTKTYNMGLVERGLVNSSQTVEKALTIINSKYAKDGWNWEGASLETAASLRFYEAGLVALGGVGDYVAIRIKAPATGTYTMGLNYATHPYNGTVAVYLLPGDTADIEGAIDHSNRVGKLSLWGEDQTGTANYTNNFNTCEAYVGVCDLTADQEYIVVFEACEASAYHATRAYISISKLTLTEGNVMQEMKTQFVSPVVADPGPVKLLEGCYYGTTMRLNGHDYLFEPVEGNKLLAFDMDSFIRKYEVDIPFLTARGITPDENGNLWLCGDNNYLYRFDPKTRTGEKMGAFDTVDTGATSGFDLICVDNCLYFGTNPTGSIIKYDIEADTYERLYTNGGSYTNGLVYKDGYLYATVYDVRDKAQENWKAIRIDLANTDNVIETDISHKMPAGQMIFDAGLAGDLLLIGGGQYQTEFVAIDINTMQLVDLGISGGIFCSVTEEVDGKVYFVLNNGPQGAGLYALDVQSRTLSNRLIGTNRGLRCADRSIIQVDDENYPGNNIAVYATATGEPMLYNLEQNKIKRGLALIEGYGVPTNIRTLTNGAAGSGDIYIGAFNVANCAAYNTATDTLSKFATKGQTDSLCYYKGELYAGNYPYGSIVRVNLADSAKNETLLTLNDDVYDQARIHTLTAGDGKLFAGSTPDKGLYGGCLAWVDLETGETYVERNVVQDQTINCIVYHDGLIYGTTSIYGGTGSVKRTDLSAKLFVYDVAAKQKLAEFDLREYMSGFTGNIEYIAGIAADPDVAENGRFWGLVSETLFSFTYDKKANELTVTQELSYSKTTYATGSGRTWFPKRFCFDGDDKLYLAFGEKGGMRRINTENTADNIRLRMPEPLYYALGEDGNLYYGINKTLYMYPLSISAEQWTAAEAVDQLIESIGTTVTLESASAVAAAQMAYDALSQEEKALVQTLDALEEAQAQLLELRIAQLPEIAVTEYKAQVLALYEVYQLMTDYQRSCVSNLPELFAAHDLCSDKFYAAAGSLFDTAEAAVQAAVADGSKLITLIDNGKEQELLLTDGVTLDLNGYTLTAEAVRAYLCEEMFGYVTDSSAGNAGLLQTAAGEDLFSSDNPDMPLYDAAAGGYRFFDYTLQLHPSPEKVDAEKQKFWFRFHFRESDSQGAALDQDAYALVKAGGSDFEVSVRLTWKGTELPQVYFGIGGDTDAFSAAWATGAAENRWFYITVSGLEDITSGKLTVEPVLSANNVEVTGGTISYEKKIEGTGGWSDVGPT